MTCLNQKYFQILTILAWGLVSVANAQAPNSNWDRLPIEAREVLSDTLLPRITTSDLVDLDGDGNEEIVLMSQSPLVSGPNASSLSDLLFQSLLMIFERTGSADQTFPYRVTVMKSVTASLPKPAHLSFQNMGGDQSPELVWLQGGPDTEGRYSEVILYSYQSGLPDPLVEAARLTLEDGWVRIYDLDGDGVSEVVAFAVSDGQTYCKDLLFNTPNGYTTFLQEIRKMGVPEVIAFQQQQGLAPNGKISRAVFEKLKDVLQIPRIAQPPSGNPFDSTPLQDTGWEFVDEP
ncbi:MAG: hypothetical protein KC944_18830 [Candidatus Omnitrophica bacterium]|nr:hypothetical protein [Candidatus Omnitrophota bacterium]MCA9436266.1 hypothetical protein [Candidatus Omnitrophota bacterium]MCA9440189.1 hypothetical protein [Candidatus Omnitrophota bacterium]MCB9769507.1 hypothetical protein [Candidatus Omnitrophota bacterium]